MKRLALLLEANVEAEYARVKSALRASGVPAAKRFQGGLSGSPLAVDRGGYSIFKDLAVNNFVAIYLHSSHAVTVKREKEIKAYKDELKTAFRKEGIKAIWDVDHFYIDLN